MTHIDDLTGDLSLAQLRKLLQGRPGIHGLEGRTPMHVQESKPTGEDIEKGDLWYQPSTEKLRIYTGSSWKEVAKQGIMGFDGSDGEDGEKGAKGDKGDIGPAGKDADAAEMYDIAAKKVISHEVKYDHEKIDPFLLGTKKVSEAGMSEGMVLQYDAKGDRLIYATIKQVVSQVSKLAGRGLSLPSQSGNSGKFLTTDGQRSSWAAVATGSFVDKQTPTGAIDDSNVTFTIASTPVSGSDHWYLNGVLQNAGASNDYTLSGATATFNTAPPTGSVLLVTYRI